MMDGIWHVYLPDGTKLGIFETSIGGDLLSVTEEIAQKVSIGDILHMDESATTKAWEVEVLEILPKGLRSPRLRFKKLSDRGEQYPNEPLKIVVTAHR